jgi:hypothetical protein
MKLVGFMSMGAMLAVASTAALAFQEQGGAPAVTTPAPAEAPSAAPAQPDLNFSAPKVDDSNAGTEVRIPGLGKLCVLPKMDFGLELLYGANDAKQQEPEAQQPAEDLTIRGSVKHNF